MVATQTEACRDGAHCNTLTQEVSGDKRQHSGTRLGSARIGRSVPDPPKLSTASAVHPVRKHGRAIFFACTPAICTKTTNNL